MSVNPQSKLFRDPLHGYISIGDDLLPIIDSREFQRLRRVSQLGVSRLTYHGAEHTRFGHSVGVYYLYKRLATELDRRGAPLAQDDLMAGLSAALLHDIGHGPFSHALEGILTPGRNHETWTQEIVTGPTQVNEALKTVDEALPEKVCNILKEGSCSSVLTSLISSQLDADRMDYLLRDSMYCGVSYGRFDVDRLIATIVPHGSSPFIAIDGRGLMAVEGYVLARYFMYWQVYYHKTTRGFECILRELWRYARNKYQNGNLAEQDVPRQIRPFFQEAVTLDDYLNIDDYDIISALKLWQASEDPVLRDMSTRFLRRHRFKSIEFNVNLHFDVQDRIKKVLERYNYTEFQCYMIFDQPSSVAYDYYTAGEEGEKPPILIIDKNGSATEVSKLSEPIKALAGRSKNRFNLYVPEECVLEVESIIRAGR